MPIIKSAKKAARQATKRKLKNLEIKKAIKLALKEFKASPSAETMRKVQSEYDKAVKKGLLKKNTASRRKSRLANLAKQLSVKPGSSAKAKAASADKTAAPKAKTAKASASKAAASKASAKTATAAKATKTTKAAAKTSTKTKTAKAAA